MHAMGTLAPPQQELRTGMRPNGIDLFKVAGIQIAIDYSWIVVFVLVSWSLSAGYFPHEYPGYGWGQYLEVGVVATNGGGG